MSDFSKKYDLEELLRKKLGNLQEAPSEDYWHAIDKGISKARFYKFGWKHFNIYTTAIAVGILVVSVALLLFSSSKKGSVPVNSLERKNIEILNTPFHDTDKKPSLNDKQEVKSKLRKDFIKTEINTQTSEKVSVMDTTHTVPSTTEEKKASTFETVKKVVPTRQYYIYQTDTIIEKDTVKVKKRRKKNRN
ncbi:MAG TPA: hypothetical protein VNW06_06455 [Cytophagaceae bacterium]|jgi:hypothetical protein|nr:hypothetical protein [Cytophagaceae bacterium]